MAIVKFDDVVVRANTKEDRFNTDKVYYVGGEHIESNEVTIKGRGLIEGSTIGPMFYFGFKAGQVLFVTRNPHLRKAGWVDFDGICSEKTFVLETKDENILCQRFLPFIMQSDHFWNYCEANKSGSVNFFINWSTLAKYEFDLPDIQTQRKLADLLWAIERTKQAYKQLISATDELVKSQFIEMFGNPEFNTKGLPIQDLGEVAFITKLAGFEYTKYIKYQDTGDIIMIRGLNCKSGRLVLDDVYWINKDVSDMLPRSQLSKGDIVLTYVGTVGEVALIDKDNTYHLAPNVAKISLTDKKKQVPEFWNYMLMIMKSYILRFASTTTQSALSMEKIRKIPFIIPETNLQKEFVSFVRQTDKSKFELTQALEALNATYKKLISENLG